MATVVLTKMFVTLLATGQSISAQSAPGRPEDYEIPVEVRTYAGGRRRAITSAGEVGTFGFTLLLVSAADKETLRGWAGQLVQVRDNLGRRFFGVYAKTSPAEVRGRPGRYHVGITLTVVTTTEGV